MASALGCSERVLDDDDAGVLFVTTAMGFLVIKSCSSFFLYAVP